MTFLTFLKAFWLIGMLLCAVGTIMVRNLEGEQWKQARSKWTTEFVIWAVVLSWITLAIFALSAVRAIVRRNTL